MVPLIAGSMQVFISNHPRLVSSVVCFGGSAAMGWIAWDAMHQGYIDENSRSNAWWRYWSNCVTEDDNPIQFWIQVVIHWVACAGLAIAGVFCLVKNPF
jgi:hypothetical protein